MLLDDDSTKSLTRFLVKTLEPICDADPAVLANYIIALLRNDKPRQELLDSCTQELEDFLKDETKPFVAKLFDYLKDLENKHSPHSHERDYDREDDDRDHKHARRDSPDGGKKRPYNDDDHRRKGGPDMDSRRRRDDDSDDERRRPKDFNRDDRYGQRNNFRGRHGGGGEFDTNRERPFFDSAASGRGGRSDRGGRYNSGAPPNNNNFRPRRQRCRDYDERGFCMRGELCTFDHGADRILVSDMNEFQKLNMETGTTPAPPAPLPTIPPPFPVNPEPEPYAPQPKRPKFDARSRFDPTDMAPYNPDTPMYGGLVSLNTNTNNNNNNNNWVPPSFDVNRGGGRARPPRFQKTVGIPEDSVPLNPTLPYNNYANMNNNNNNSILLPTHTSPPIMSGSDKRVVVSAASKPPSHTHHQQPSAAVELVPTVGGGGEDKAGRAGGNPNFNPNFTPNYPKSQTTLLITNIPPDLNSIDKLNGHFKKFGTVVNLQVKFAANKAYVQFTSHAEALRAMRSVDAVLGNRFIKVFWASRPDDQPGAQPTSPAGALPKPEPPVMKPKAEIAEAKAAPATPIPAAPAVSAVAKELHERRQQQIEQYKKLLSQMSNKLTTVGPKEKEELLASMRTTTNKLEELIKKETSSLQMKQQQQQQTQQQQPPTSPPSSSSATTSSTTPSAPTPKPTKAQKEKERLDRELDQLAHTSAPSSSSSTTSSTLQSSTSSLASSTSSLGSSSNAVGSPPSATTTTPTTTTTTTTTATPSSSSLAHLQNLKSTLEQTALAMGLDTSTRGRGRGRGGRGAPRGRGGRGAGRGGVGGVSAVVGGGGMTLDNRTTTLHISALPADLRTENTLRVHFQPFGDVKTIAVLGDSASIQFATRRAAENALSQGRQYKTQNLNLSWQNTAPKANTTPAQQQPKSSANAVAESPTNRAEEHEHQEDGGTTEEAHNTQDHHNNYEEEEDDDEGAERSWKH